MSLLLTVGGLKTEKFKKQNCPTFYGTPCISYNLGEMSSFNMISGLALGLPALLAPSSLLPPFSPPATLPVSPPY